MMPLAAGDLFSNLGSILAGVCELLVALGAGIGFLIRSRRNARRERSRTEAAAQVAAQRTKEVLESRLEAQHTAQIEQFKQQIQEMVAHQSVQIEQYKQQIRDLTGTNKELLHRILSEAEKNKDK